MPNEQDLQVLTLEGQKRLTMTGVESVDGFSEQSLKLTLAGKRVLVTGSHIKITSFNKATGSLTADGMFDSVRYDAKRLGLRRRFAVPAVAGKKRRPALRRRGLVFFGGGARVLLVPRRGGLSLRAALYALRRARRNARRL